MMDFDNILNIASQNQGLSSVQVSRRLSLADVLLMPLRKLNICGYVCEKRDQGGSVNVANFHCRHTV